MAGKSQGKRQTTRRRKAPQRRAGGGTWPWLLALVVVAGGIVTWENRDRLPPTLGGLLARVSADEKPAERQPAEQARAKPERKPVWSPPGETRVAAAPSAKPVPRAAAKAEAVPTPPAAVPTVRPTLAVANARPATEGKAHAAQFYYCGTSGLDNCVAAGDTFWFHKARITLADAVAPGTENARCQQERDLGFAAKVRLRDLLNGGGFDLASVGGQGHLVARNGRSLGAMLIAEGLAKPRGAKPAQWCR